MRELWSFSILILVILSTIIYHATSSKPKKRNNRPDLANLPPDVKSSDEYFNMALDTDNYRLQADYYWHSVLLGPGEEYSVEEAYSSFIKVFQSRGILEQAHIYMANEYLARGDMQNGINQCKIALNINNKTIEAYHLIARALPVRTNDASEKIGYLLTALEIDPKYGDTHSLLGSTYFEVKNWDKSLYHLEKAVQLNPSLTKAHANAVYLRNNMCKWGKNGTQYFQDMEAIEKIVRNEMVTTMKSSRPSDWQSVVFPHTALAYRVDPIIKFAAAASYARFEKSQAISRGEKETDHSLLMPKYLAESVDFIRNVTGADASGQCSDYQEVEVDAVTGVAEETSSAPKGPNGCRIFNHSDGTAFEFIPKNNFRIKVGYVSAGLTTKALTYLVQDMFTFHNSQKFEIHVFATSKPDPQFFIKSIMRGVDFREKIQYSAEHFYDVSGKSRADVVKMIQSKGIHILINWDGYAQNGAKLEGLFGLHSAPIQVSHMAREYMGTIGADIDYIITDKVASPVEFEGHYSEKFIYMPHSFIINSFSYLQPEIMPPVLTPPDSPQKQGCGGLPASFVFCNFNKHLKFDPIVFRMWLETLQSTEGSVLCLQENPKESIKYLSYFIKKFDKSLMSRIRYVPFDHNIGPFETKKRVEGMCNAVLDNFAYGAHTTAVEALWAGVPVLTFSGAKDMSGRVGCSIMTALGLPEMIAADDQAYKDTAIKLAANRTFWLDVRSRLVQTSLMLQPRHQFWDLARYVRNMEKGFEEVWFSYLSGAQPRHVYIKDD